MVLCLEAEVALVKLLVIFLIRGILTVRNKILIIVLKLCQVIFLLGWYVVPHMLQSAPDKNSHFLLEGLHILSAVKWLLDLSWLVLDFDFIEAGAEQGAPKYMEWYGAFSLMVTLVWLYLEILRLLAKLRSR